MTDLRPLVRDLVDERSVVGEEILCTAEDGPMSTSVVMQWCDYAQHRAAPEVTSFCNLMRTHDGGSHVKGFMRGTRDVLRRTFEVADQDELDELTRGLRAVVSVNLIDPAYGAPTKDLLKNPEAHTLVRRAVIDGLGEALAAQPALFEALTKRLADTADESPV